MRTHPTLVIVSYLGLFVKVEGEKYVYYNVFEISGERCRDFYLNKGRI